MMSVYIVHTFIIFRCIRFEKERQWLCVRMYVCASLFLGDNEPKKKIHHQWWVLSQVDSFSRLGLVYQKCFLFHDHNYHVCFSDTGEGLRLRNDIVTPSLSYIRRLQADKPKTPKIKIKLWPILRRIPPFLLPFSSPAREKPDAINLVRILWCVTCVVRRQIDRQHRQTQTQIQRNGNGSDKQGRWDDLIPWNIPKKRKDRSVRREGFKHSRSYLHHTHNLFF